MKKHKLPLSLLSFATAMCLGSSPVMASTFVYNGTTYGTTPGDITEGVIAMGDLQQVTITAAASALETGTLYYSPSNHLLVIDGGKTSGKLSSILDGATYAGGNVTAAEITGVVITGNGQLANSVFYDLENLQTVRLEDGVTIVDSAQAMFADCPNLTSLVAAGEVTLPANITSMFTHAERLTSIPEFNYSAVTNATQAFYGAGLKALDLSTMTGATNVNKMLKHATALEKIKFGAKPVSTGNVDNSAWTSRWWYDVNNNDKLDPGEVAKLGQDWVAGTMELTSPYHMMTTKEQYIAAGLGDSTYYVEALAPDSLTLVNGATNKMNGYCINYLADFPTKQFFTQEGLSELTDWDDYLDSEGVHGEVTIARNLGKYEDDPEKALKTILFYGYPNNGTGLVEETDTTAFKQAYYAATQALIWNTLSGIEKNMALTDTGVNNETSQSLYGILAEKTYDNYKSDLPGYASDGLSLYIPDTQTVQNIISGRYSVTISKQDITGSSELPGAKLTVSTSPTISEDTTVDTWTSTTTPHRIAGLIPGKKYYLTEVTAPAGYEIAEQQSFVISGHNQIVKMQDDYAPHTVTVQKIDGETTKARVAGAVLKLTGTDTKGTAVTSQTITTTATADGKFTNLKPGSYTITEITTPAGYETAQPKSFSITMTDPADDAKNYTVTMIDKKLSLHTITVKKVDDSAVPARVAGAVLTLTGKTADGKEITAITKTTTASADVTFENILPGTYKITETTTPSGYKTASAIDVTVTDTAAADDAAKYTFTMVDKKNETPTTTHTVTVKKVDDSAVPARVAGAVLTLTGKTSAGTEITPVVKTTSASADVIFTGLEAGTYKITETTTPSGYQTASPINVTITDTSGSDAVKYTFTMVDKKNTTTNVHTITVKKMDDAAVPARVAGAVLTLTGTLTDGSNFTPVTKTTSATEDVTFTNLKPGTYKIAETTTPAGYQTASAITVTITDTDPKDDATKYTYTMVDKKTLHTVTVKKVDDTASAARVNGAVLTLTGKTAAGTEITAKTVTTSTSSDAKFTDLVPGSYTITETSTPTGYQTATPIKFELKDEDVSKDATNYTFTMVDKKIQYATLEVKKVDPKGTALAGAQFKLYSQLGLEVTSFTSATATTKLTNLTPGTYRLVETQAPAGYEKADDKTVTLTANGTTTVTITDNYKPHTLIIKKQDDTGARVAGAVLTVTGSTLAGNNIETITFTTSADKDKELALLPGNYKITETTTPEGYTTATAASVSITVTDDTKTVTLIDKKKAETKTETKTNTKTDTKSGDTSAAKAAKTGDEAPIGALLALAGLAIAGIVGGVIWYRKKKK